jgi:8-oxo-dGTP pyrophosphatase MutT (NUDIX family)
VTKARARQETSAGGVVYRVDGSNVLFLLICDSYGNWGFPKGHVERHEDVKTAAVREVKEETGLAALGLHDKIDVIEWSFRFRGRQIHKRCHFYLMESATSDTRPQRAEGITECKWVPFSEADALISYGNARDVLRRANEMVIARPAVA